MSEVCALLSGTLTVAVRAKGECYILTFPTQIFPAGHRSSNFLSQAYSTFRPPSTQEKASAVEIQMAK